MANKTREKKTEEMPAWKRKLTSRKLWMSISSFVSMLVVFFGYSENTATQVASLIMGGAAVVAYVIGEGLADAGNKKGDTENEGN